MLKTILFNRVHNQISVTIALQLMLSACIATPAKNAPELDADTGPTVDVVELPDTKSAKGYTGPRDSDTWQPDDQDVELNTDVPVNPDGAIKTVNPEDYAECSDSDKKTLREETTQIFQATCGSCHTPQGQNPVQSKVNDILDLDSLIQTQMIIPGAPEKSPPTVRMKDGTMPPVGVSNRPTDNDIALVEQWIKCLEPPKANNWSFVTTDDYLKWARKDMETNFQLNEQKFVRYFSLVHLYNVGVSDKKLDLYRSGITKLLNSLSWNAKVVPAIPIDTRKLVYRIDLRDYDWEQVPITENAVSADLNDNIWNRIEFAYPYAVEYTDQVDAEYLYTFGQTRAPIIQADWFAANASIPPLYHEILGLPKTQGELETLLGVNIQSNITQGKVKRAGMGSSNVSVNNRVVERHELGLSGLPSPVGNYNGAFWVSYDFGDNKGVKNIFQHPVDFVHDGSEFIFSLPNGFQAYLITDANGKRIDKAPTSIVADPISAPPEVTNGLSCISCHYQGMNAAKDQIRDIMIDYDSQYPGEVIGVVLTLYPEDTKFQGALSLDKARFSAALAAANIPWASERAEEPVSQLAYEFDEVMSLNRVATSVGLSQETFTQNPGIDRLKSSRAEIATLVDKGGVLKRELFDESYRDIVCFLDLAKPASSGTEETGCAIARICNDTSGIAGDVTLRLGNIELQALEGKCSPCRAVPVGLKTPSSLSVINVEQSIQDGQVINQAVVQFNEEVQVEFEDDEEYLLRLIPVVENNEVVGVELQQELIEAPLTCDKVP